VGKKAEELMPLARTERLIIEELPGEVLVLDLDDNKAHCLNPTSALVWRCCDGMTTVAEVARRLSRELNAPADEEVVGLALAQLDRHRLLKRPAARTSPARRSVSRRELILKYAPAALALPAVMSIVTPSAAQLGSLRPLGAACSLGIQCASSYCCCGACTATPCPIIDPGGGTGTC
jgi:hypothetical protein